MILALSFSYRDSVIYPTEAGIPGIDALVASAPMEDLACQS